MDFIRNHWNVIFWEIGSFGRFVIRRSNDFHKFIGTNFKMSKWNAIALCIFSVQPSEITWIRENHIVYLFTIVDNMLTRITLHKLHNNGTNNKLRYVRSSVVGTLIPIFSRSMGWNSFENSKFVFFLRFLNRKTNTNYDYVGIWPTVTPMVVPMKLLYYALLLTFVRF